MRLLHVITDTDISGVGVVVETIAKRINSDFRFYVAMPTNSVFKDRLSNIRLVKVIEIEGIDDKSFSVKGVINLFRIMKKVKPDIVHANECLSAQVAGRMYKKCYIVNSVHFVQKMPSSFLKKKIKASIHNMFTDKIIGISDGVYQSLLHIGIKHSKVVKVDNGADEIRRLDSSEIDSLKEQIGGKNKLVIGYLARMEDIKNPLILIDIAKVLLKMTNQFVFYTAGVGSLENKLDEEIAKNNLSKYFYRVRYVDDLAKFYNVIDVAVNTSKSEAISLMLLESMSSRKPIIAFNVDRLSQIVIDKDNGYLIKPYDYKDFAFKIFTLLDEKLRTRMGEKSYKIYRYNYSSNNMVNRMENIYRKGFTLLQDKMRG